MPKKTLKLDWKGPQVLKNVLDATVQASEEVAENTADRMENDAPVLSGELRDGIGYEGPVLSKYVVTTTVGVDARVRYAFVVEFVHPSKAGFMRRAADAEFPKVIPLIKKYQR